MADKICSKGMAVDGRSGPNNLNPKVLSKNQTLSFTSLWHSCCRMVKVFLSKAFNLILYCGKRKNMCKIVSVSSLQLAMLVMTAFPMSIPQSVSDILWQCHLIEKK